MGLDIVEKAVVHAALAAASSRAMRLEPYRLDEVHSADILLLDAASPRAHDAYRLYRRRHPAPAHMVTIGNGFKYRAHWDLPRPLKVSRLMDVIGESARRVASERDGVAASCEFPHASVLVVGTSTSSLLLVRDALASLVGRVELVASGEDASTCIEREAFDVVVLEVGLEQPDAYELTWRIKSSSSAAVIMLLKADAATSRVEAQAAGCDTFLIHPVNELILREVIAEYLDVG